ncbi:hypothetical protein KKF29_03790, partial [Patescibacteria group bacterium]|nr:hypothetical protein [Patescibacteria group bacterium]
HLVYKFIYPHKNLWSATKILFLAGLIIFAIYSYFNIGLEHLYKSRIFYNILVQALILVLPLFFLLLGFVKDNFKNKKIAHIFIGLLQTLFILLVYIGWSNLSELELFGARVISNNYEVMFWFVFVFLDGLFLFQLLKNNYLKINNKTLLFPALFLFITPIAFALIHVQHNVSMFKPYILLGSVLLGAMLYSMFKNIRAYSNQLIILFLILAFSLSGFFYIQTNFRDRLWSQELVSQVAEYINVNTKDEEEIFTAGTIFATQANQRIALDISHPLIYGDGHVDMADYSGIESVPAPQEIADYLEENVNIIIMDHRTRALFDNNEELKKLLDEGVYKKSDQIDIIKIYRKD